MAIGWVKRAIGGVNMRYCHELDSKESVQLTRLAAFVIMSLPYRRVCYLVPASRLLI